MKWSSSFYVLRTAAGTGIMYQCKACNSASGFGFQFLVSIGFHLVWQKEDVARILREAHPLDRKPCLLEDIQDPLSLEW